MVLFMPSSLTFDIAIVGGGLAGTSLALALATETKTANLKILVIEAHANEQNTLHPSFDGKALALSHGSAQLYQQWGLWSEIKQHTGLIEKIEVSDKGHLGHCFFDDKDFFKQEEYKLGYVIEAQVLGGVLAQRLKHISKENDNIQVIAPDSLAELNIKAQHAELKLRSGLQVQCKLIIGADGANSQVRQLLPVNTNEDDYGQWAIGANIQLDREHGNIAYERFTEFGPLAMLPMPEQRFGMVWCTHQLRSQELSELSDEDFLVQLQAMFGYRAGRFIKVGQRQAYPLKRLSLDHFFYHRCLLIGNAAHAVHPIAGQGFNLGMRDIAGIVATLQDLADDAEIGTYPLWQTYIKARQQDVDQILTATDGLVRCFSNQDLPLVAARNLGLMALQNMPSVKQTFAETAMGLKRP